MGIEVKVPTLPESVTDATIAAWHKQQGDQVTQGENIVDLETDKIVLEVVAVADGILTTILKEVGSHVKAQEVLAVIEPGAIANTATTTAATTRETAVQEPPTAHSARTVKSERKKQSQRDLVAQPAQPTPKPAQQPTPRQSTDTPRTATHSSASPAIAQPAPATDEMLLSPAKRRAAAAGNAQPASSSLSASSQLTADQAALSSAQEALPLQEAAAAASLTMTTETQLRSEQRVPMSRIRVQIAKHLLAVTQHTAMLTTFNEINMTACLAIRTRYREPFEKKHHVRLGFMSFFIVACVEALKSFPVINASIDGEDIVYHHYFDIGVAVSTTRGLVVPVLRNVEQMSMADIEQAIVDYAEKAKEGKLTLQEMQGGTFTITNGGVFGSLLSTPIINLPQCAILGMHRIQERPIVENGQIVVRPMMYVALSYDHRLVDGKDSVTFLATVKSLLEDPTRLLLNL